MRHSIFSSLKLPILSIHLSLVIGILSYSFQIRCNNLSYMKEQKYVISFKTDEDKLVLKSVIRNYCVDSTKILSMKDVGS